MCLILLKKQTSFDLKITDILVVGYLLFMVFSSSTGINSTASMEALVSTFLGSGIYLIVRVYFKSRIHLKKLLLSLSVVFLFLALLSCISFFVFATHISSGEFHTLYDVRHLIRPLGHSVNVWMSVLLSSVGLIMLTAEAYDKNKKIEWLLHLTFALIICCLILSFSRGAYICIIVIVIAYIIWQIIIVRKNRQNLTRMITILSLISLPIVLYPKEVKATLNMFETVSQQRSINARFNMADVAWKIFDSIPLHGSGEGSYSIVANNLLYENDNIPYTSFPGNIIVQSFIEKGLLGTVLLGIMLINLFGIIIRNLLKRQHIYWIFLITLLVCGLKELAFPTLFGYRGLLVMLFTYMAIIENCNNQNKRIYFIKNNVLIWNFPCAICLVLSILIWRNEHDKTRTELFNNHLLSGNYSLAMQQIPLDSEAPVDLIHKSLVLWKVFLLSGDEQKLDQLHQCLSLLLGKFPNDNIMRFNYSIVLLKMGRTDQAFKIMKTLSDAYPNVAIYNLGLYYYYKLINNKIESDNYLIKSILINPLLLESNLLFNLKNEDSAHYEKIKGKLIKKISSDSAKDPIQLAKQGKIFLELGDSINAHLVLKETVEMLPNLSRSWFYLSLIDNDNQELYNKRAHVLQEIDFVYEQDACKKREQKYQNEIYLSLIRNYQLKYKSWYGQKPPINDILFLKDLL